jgi:hypothetical protein
MRQWLNSSTVMPPLAVSVAAVCLLALPGPASAGSFIPPVGVTSYRLAFVTDDKANGFSTNIASYNSFVTADAANNPSLPSTTWTAIASTASISASSNISCGGACSNLVPIFLIDGTEVATSADAMFSGAILNTIDETENGVLSSSYVWTGSNADGSAATGHEMGSTGPVAGTDSSANFMFDVITGTADASLPLYAISGKISVVPEPTSLSLLAFGGVVAGLLRKRGRRRAR